MIEYTGNDTVRNAVFPGDNRPEADGKRVGMPKKQIFPQYVRG